MFLTPACQCGFDYEDTNHFLLYFPLFYVEQNVLLANLLTLGITNVNTELLLKSDDCNKDIFRFIHHYIDCITRL